jgi:hypothetical protein
MVVSIDIDPTTKKIAENINLIELNNGTFEAVVCDMAEYTYSFQPEIVINTSCEHITDNLYRRWIENIPGNPLIVCQSNNLLSVKDHITCSEDIDDFIKRLQLKTILYAESYPCSGYTRFMVIGRKND